MKLILICVLLLIVSKNIYSQVPEKISYQAIVRYSNNSVVADTNVDVKIKILKGSTHGVGIYEETHYVHANKNGLVTLEIGTGNVVYGSIKSINWENGPFFIETQVDPTARGNFSVIGVSQFLSVPYALHAKSATTLTGTISVSQISDMDLYAPYGSELSFDKWDKDASDDFDGKYDSLHGAPELYTKNQVDSIKTALLESIDGLYSKKAVIIAFTSSRNMKATDVGNTIVCTTDATLTLPLGFFDMEVGKTINLEAHNGAKLSIKAAQGVDINYIPEGIASFSSAPGTVRFGLLRKSNINSYIISGQ